VGASAEDKIAPKTLEFLEATTISGYVEASYVANVSSDIVSKNNKVLGVKGGVGDFNQLRAFDENPGFSLNAIKLVLEKPLGEGDWAAGYRADLLFGEDANQLNRAEGTGNPNVNGGGTVGTYIEQGYVAFRVPVGNGIDFKLGRFVALSGYEVIESPANLNFSRGLLFTWATPLAHNGLLASYRFNDNVDVQAAIVNGWNTWVADSTSPAFTGRVGLKNSSGTASLGVSGYLGRGRTVDPAAPGAIADGTLGFQEGYRWFVDGVANFKPTEKVLLGLEALYGNQKNPTAAEGRDEWWGTALYAKVQLTDKVSLAGRAEYLNDSRGFLFSDDHASFDTNHEVDDLGSGGKRDRDQVWSLTGTLNLDVWKNMLLRFEARYDEASFRGIPLSSVPDGRPFSPHNNQLTFAVDAVYSF